MVTKHAAMAQALAFCVLTTAFWPSSCEAQGATATPPECIVPGYRFWQEHDRFDGDIFQAWEFDRPLDVRTYCERTVECAAFNYPLGLLKHAVDGEVLPQRRIERSPSGEPENVYAFRPAPTAAGPGLGPSSLNDYQYEAPADESEDPLDPRLSSHPCAGVYIRENGPVETVELICPNVTARRDDGEATYGGIERTFDTVLLRSKDDSSQTSRQTVVLPSQIECTHPSASKFHSGKTRVTCMWTASPDIHCEFWVTRDTRCDRRQIALFVVSVLICICMGAVSAWVLYRKFARPNWPLAGAGIGGWQQKPEAYVDVEGKRDAAGPGVGTQPPHANRETWAHMTTVVGVLAGSVVAALQAVADCDL